MRRLMSALAGALFVSALVACNGGSGSVPPKQAARDPEAFVRVVLGEDGKLVAIHLLHRTERADHLSARGEGPFSVAFRGASKAELDPALTHGARMSVVA